jgi:hypothetical protein
MSSFSMYQQIYLGFAQLKVVITYSVFVFELYTTHCRLDSGTWRRIFVVSSSFSVLA